MTNQRVDAYGIGKMRKMLKTIDRDLAPFVGDLAPFVGDLVPFDRDLGAFDRDLANSKF